MIFSSIETAKTIARLRLRGWRRMAEKLEKIEGKRGPKMKKGTHVLWVKVETIHPPGALPNRGDG